MTTLQALRRLVKPRDLVWPVLAGIITLLSALSLTVVSAWLITRSWQMPPLMDITLAVTSVRALGISRAAFRYLDRLVSHDVALRTAERSRVKLWEHFVADRTLALRERSDIVTALGANIDALADAVVRSIVPALVALMTSLIAVIFVALLSPAAAVLLAVGLLLAGGVAPYLTYRATARSSQRRAAAIQSHAAAVEALLSDAAGLRIHGQLDEAVSAASSSSKTVAAIDDATGRANARASALSTAASVLTAVLTVVVASWLVTDSAGGAGGGLLHSPEWLTVLVLVPLAAFESVGPLPAAAQTLAQSREALLTLASSASESGEADAMRSAPAPTAPIHTSTLPQNHLAVRPTLQVQDLIVGYPDDNSSNTAEEPAAQPAQLPMQNFEVTFGDYREITAPSGSGKTTLLKTIAGLIPPVAGTVTIADGDGRELWRSAASAGEPPAKTRSSATWCASSPRMSTSSPRRCGTTSLLVTRRSATMTFTPCWTPWACAIGSMPHPTAWTRFWTAARTVSRVVSGAGSFSPVRLSAQRQSCFSTNPPNTSTKSRTTSWKFSAIPPTCPVGGVAER